MKEVQTSDGSITFYNEYFQDVYNSVSGAMEEAHKKFVIPSKIPALAKSGHIKILDVCFGVGYNSLMAIHEALKVNPNCQIEITGLENDAEVIEQILKMKFKPELKQDYKLIQEAAKDCLNQPNKSNKQISITLILEDARKSINKLTDLYDAVFLDPFTPKTCPHLWTAPFIKDISKRMKPNAILTTYSCARMVRDNLNAANLEVHDGPKVGRFAPSTFAVKKPL